MRRARKRDSASSMSAAMSSPISPMKRRVRWKFPGSTHFAPGTPEHSNDSRSLSSGGKPIPTKRRSMPSRPQSHRSADSGEQREDAGVAIKAVARDLAIGKETDQREFAEALADEPGLHGGIAKQRGATGDTADVDPGLGGSIEPAGKLTDHAGHIAACALGVAAAEQD